MITEALGIEPEELDYEERGVCRHDASETSQEAAESCHVAYVFQEILDALAEHPEGLICEELEAATEMRHQTVSACLAPMERRGWLVRPGQKRRASSGRRQFVCYLPQHAPEPPETI